MEEVFVDVRGLPTKVLTWGKGLGEPFGENETEVVILVPGNPGLVEFYKEFLELIWIDFGRRIPVWTVGYAGLNDKPGERSLIPNIRSKEEEKFNLQGQITHKTEFIQKYVPDHVKIHLVSHSIGSWMCLQMLKNSKLKQKFVNCYFLFPALEDLAKSPMGTLFTYLLKPSYSFLELVYIYFFMQVPESVSKLILTVYFWCARLPDKIFWIIYNYIMSPAPLARSYKIAEDAMNTIKNLEVNVFRENIDLLHIYYGSCDGWVPVRRYQNIVQQVPAIDARLCKHALEHGFVVDHSKQMAKILCEWIRKNGEKNNNLNN